MADKEQLHLVGPKKVVRLLEFEKLGSVGYGCRRTSRGGSPEAMEQKGRGERRQKIRVRVLRNKVSKELGFRKDGHEYHVESP